MIDADNSSPTFSIVVGNIAGLHGAMLDGFEHGRKMLRNGETALISIGPSLEPITVKQRKFLHGAVLTQISEQASVDGVRFLPAVWKEHYRARFVPDTVERVVRIEFDPVLQRMRRMAPETVTRRTSSEELGVRAYAEFTSQVIDHATLELGVEFHFTADEQSLIVRRSPRRKNNA